MVDFNRSCSFISNNLVVKTSLTWQGFKADFGKEGRISKTWDKVSYHGVYQMVDCEINM